MSDDELQQSIREYREVLALSGWQQAHCSEVGEDVRVSYNVVKGWCSVLIEKEVAVPLEHLKVALRPETFAHFPEVAQGLFEYDSVDITAPGDALMRFRISMEQDASRMLRNFAKIGPGSDDDGWQSSRLCLRADVPQPGDFSRFVLPVRGGRHNATITTLRQGQNPGTASITALMMDPLSTFSEWHMRICQALVKTLRRWITVIREQIPMMLLPAQRHYLTLALRSCPRGPPLLPLPRPSCDSTQVAVGGHFWGPAQTAGFSGFSFAHYLSVLLRALGCPARVYCSMYGQSLVPYQAIVVRDEWECITPTFNQEFSSQRSAYRLLKGGNGAPTVIEDVEPRFLREATSSSPSPAYLDVNDFTLLKFEKNTFLEFSGLQPGEPAEVRAKEYP